MLRVTVIRHGHAGEAPRDADRALTGKGRRVVRAVGDALAELDTSFDVIVSSPLVRAVQTAEIISERLRFEHDLVVDPVFVPEGHPEQVLNFVAGLLDSGNIALVGHEPLCSATVGYMTGQGFRGLRKGEAVRVRMPEGPRARGQLRWSLDPTTLERVKG